MKKVGTDYVFLVIGDRCWGRGNTEKAAKAEARKAGSSNALKSYDVYLAPPGARVDDLGDRVVWPGESGELIHIKSVRNGKEVPVE